MPRKCMCEVQPMFGLARTGQPKGLVPGLAEVGFGRRIF